MTVLQQTGRRPSPVVVAVRSLLLVVLLVAGVHHLRAPDDRPVGDLLQGLARGSVHSLVLVDVGPGAAGSGFPALWTDGGLHPHLTRYAVADGQSDPVRDAVRASPAPPRMHSAAYEVVDPRSGPGLHLAYGLLRLPLLAWLLAGPEPRRATRWAWFWVGAVLPAAWLTFLVFEPAALWRVREAPPRHPRVTAGWALLGALLVSAVLSEVLPGALAAALWIR